MLASAFPSVSRHGRRSKLKINHENRLRVHEGGWNALDNFGEFTQNVKRVYSYDDLSLLASFDHNQGTCIKG